MSEPITSATATATLTKRPLSARHYQAICGLALAAIFLVQVQQSTVAMPITLLANLFVVFIGTLGVLYRLRLSPMFVLIALAVPHLVEQHQSNQLFNPDFRSLRFEVADVLLCIGMLTYVTGHYRLHGLWFGVSPVDARLPAAQQVRTDASMTEAELLGLILPIPAFALVAQLAALVLRQHWTLLELTPRWTQFLVLSWTLLLVMFLAAHGFRYWRRLQMDRFTAQLMLQDILWQQTRGEQRRIQRWIVWKKLMAAKNDAAGDFAKGKQP
jgi:hypothetical protein